MLLAHAGRGNLPPPLTWERLFSVWTFEPVVAVGVLIVGAAYLYAVWLLHRRGDRWPIGRSICFVGLGLGTILVATQSALGAYDSVLISVHMVQHMLLAMVAPVFLAVGAPVTLALRVLPAQPRRLLLAALHSRLARAVSFPVVAGALFIANPWILYFTPLYQATLENPVLHDLLHAHFLLVGCLFSWPLLGRDPVPGRIAYPLRLLVVFVTLPFHAFLGITIMGSRDLIAEEWYRSLGRSWPPSPAVDQEWAGGILWSSGDLIGLLFLTVLFVQWVADSRREAAREDRRLDRLERQAQQRPAAEAYVGSIGPDPSSVDRSEHP